MFHTPTSLTKELKIQRVASTGKRRIRLSTNFLNGFGFLPGTRLAAQIQSTGFDLFPTQQADSPWQVHSRAYAHRRNNPTESIIDIKGNAFIDRVVPAAVERLHFTLLQQRIIVRPVYAPLFHIRRSMRDRTGEALKAFLELSSGLDGIAFANAGFNIDAVLEWRPPEARDVTDLTETGICTFLKNHKPRFVINEDIAAVDMRALANRLKDVEPLALLSIGIQCDDFSSVKSFALRRAEVAEFRPSSRELGYYAAKLIEELKPATLCVENVAGWHGSQAQAILGAVLTRMGYYVQARVLNAADYGSLTSRSRCYLIASCWPGFEFPAPTGRNTIPLGEILAKELPDFQEVGHTRAVAAAKPAGRDRFCPLEACVAPTLIKSQGRRTKDSVYFTDSTGRVLYPSLPAIKKLHGFGAELDLSTVSTEVATEQIGQGIDLALHQIVAKRLFEHISLNSSIARLNHNQSQTN
jgi:DNA (cytosine-5)-methyltransferase 1